jgi:threonine dehydratase
MDNLVNEILKSELRIRPYTLTTPLLHSLPLSEDGANVYLKLENEQHTGSFKARGSMSKVLSLTDAQRRRGVVAASTGNYGLGVARALKVTGTKGIIFVPENADASKIAAIKQYGAEVRYTVAGLPETISHAQAKQAAKDAGMAWASPYNDYQVIGGQGTIAVELVQQLANIDYVFVTVGGGGMIAGIAAYLRAVSPHAKVIGCLPENAAEMYHCVKAGKFVSVDTHDTLSDGSAGGFEESSITLPLCGQLVDDWTLATEDEIKNAIKLVLDTHHKLIEGAAAVALASYLKRKAEFVGKNVVIIICGGNMATSTLKKVLTS